MNLMAPIVEAPPSPPPRSAARSAGDDDFAAHLEIPDDDSTAPERPEVSGRAEEGTAPMEDDAPEDSQPDIVVAQAPQSQETAVAPLVLQFVQPEPNTESDAAPNVIADASVDGAEPPTAPQDASPDAADVGAPKFEPKSASDSAPPPTPVHKTEDATQPLPQVSAPNTPPQTQQPQASAAPVASDQASVNAATTGTPAQAAPVLSPAARQAPVAQKGADKIAAPATSKPAATSDAAAERAAFERAVSEKTGDKAPAHQSAPDPVALAPTLTRESGASSGVSPHHMTTALQEQGQTQRAALDAASVRHAPAAAQVAREIVRRFDGGSTRFELRLDPPELGRVEVRMEVSRDHRVTAVVAADNPQALAELSKHARDLEMTLQSAGLELSENGLSFDLRQSDREFEAADTSSSDSAGADDDLAVETATVARPLGYDRWRGVRVDMMV